MGLEIEPAESACRKKSVFDWFSAGRLRCAATPGPAAAPARASRSDALWCPHASQSHASSPIVLAGPSQLSTAPHWLLAAKYRGQGQRLGPPAPRHQFLARTLHQRVHPCRGRPSDAITPRPKQQ